MCNRIRSGVILCNQVCFSVIGCVFSWSGVILYKKVSADVFVIIQNFENIKFSRHWLWRRKIIDFQTIIVIEWNMGSGWNFVYIVKPAVSLNMHSYKPATTLFSTFLIRLKTSKLSQHISYRSSVTYCYFLITYIIM